MSPQRRTALVSVAAACVLISLKLATGLASGSLGLVSEAVHSGTDLVAALLTLFAVETDSFNIEPPQAEAVRDVNVAYWQSGWVAYVLSGTGDQKELLSLASRLSR